MLINNYLRAAFRKKSSKNLIRNTKLNLECDKTSNERTLVLKNYQIRSLTVNYYHKTFRCVFLKRHVI